MIMSSRCTRNLSHLSVMEASTCESGCPTLQFYKKELKSPKNSLPKCVKLKASLLKSLRCKTKIKKESEKNPCRERLKVLGVGWDNQRDLLFLDLASPLETINNGTITKRAILGATRKFYDPLGLLSPVIILSKIIFQTICKSKVDWDDPVDSFLHEQWLKLVQDTRKVGVVELKRHYFRGSSSADLQSAQLHGFADASEKAYGAVVYLRVELISGTFFTQLVSSKTRVAPINVETIPRMELMGALILARLISTVLTAFKGTLNIDSAFCWLDSQIAL